MKVKKYYGILVIFVASACVMGCSKKQEALEDMQAPMSIESLSAMTNDTKALSSNITGAAETAPVALNAPQGAVKLEALPPAGPYKPTVLEIQTALKNSGFYSGSVDGKKGPMTTKAIEAFQKQNNLSVDGKVGAKTWAVMSVYLNTVSTKAPATVAGKKQKK